MFESVLVANRGEIAVRVCRTLRKLGVRAIAVHTDADADAPHLRAADEAVRIDSYLSVEELLRAARRTGAEAVHPGYGFLAENAGFARACAEAGLVFIGPPADAIELMGDKIHAKAAVSRAGVPVVPGSSGDGLTDDQLADAAAEVGLPVLLKPSAGGGGKGMRLVREAEHLREEIAAARREARASFGDDTLLLERWIDRPRHIEIQVLADAHGNVVHLGERECSLQRRHQKLIEEAPSVLLDPHTRAAMGEAAVRAARSCGYTGAGTVEFIVPGGDPSSYYFMEMNTRLQVEHPVTELVTGLDLVEWQLRVAAGEELRLEQSAVDLDGHAVEARICAEDPGRGFLPTGGRVLLLEEPDGLDGTRVDSGLADGQVVGSSYDPMLAKVIAWGPDRATALRRLRAALARTTVLGVTTNAGYLRRLLADTDVVAGDLDTGLVERRPELTVTDPADDEAALVAAALARQLALLPGTGTDAWSDPFAQPTGWRVGGRPAWTRHQLRLPGGEPVTVAVRPTGDPREGSFEARLGEDGIAVTVRVRADGNRLTVSSDGLTRTFAHATDNSGAQPVEWLGRDGDSWAVHVHDPLADVAAGAGAHAGDSLTAPMPGTVTVVKAAVGERVTKGQPLLVLEAMKMEHVISAPHDGVLEQLRVSAGSTVAMDELLAVVSTEEAAA
ncbi:acetyl/propionyl/methylcrotonyl-CoA carboxylase subunit alpha [Streptacidiphilus monticola]|uniref:biotin carboxylase n=1 Tax=Streptacidiphilus monticola TaxID=2161674 RepID=A0ABW1G7B4_9ACTN